MKEIRVYNSFSNKAFTDNLSSAISLGKESDIDDIPYDDNNGLTLEVNDLNSDTLEILVNTNIHYRSENSNIIYLFIQTHGLINCVSTETILSEDIKIYIPKNKLIPGINQITIFNSKGEPVGERFIYTHVRENNFLTLHSVDSCNLRNKITLEVEPGEEASAAFNTTSLSISVAPVTNDLEIMDINDYMVFGTEYGLLPWKIIEGRKPGGLLPEVMDSILLNIRSNWIDWKRILSDDLPRFKYQIEKEDHFLQGKLLTSDQRPADTGKFLLLCTPGKEAGFQYSRTDNEGNFSFNIHIDEGLKDLIIMPDDIYKNHKIILESSFSDQYPQSEISVDSVKVALPTYTAKWSINYQVRRIFGVSALGGPLNQVYLPLKPVRFYGKPDIGLIMADYISLPVMEEVFLELLPRVSLKKKFSVYEISITDRVDNTPYVTTPCLLIDGVITKDASMIANLDPVIIEKIDVIRERYVVGKYFFPGIINVITKSGDYSCVSLHDYMIRLPYRVIEPVWSFVSPDYSSTEMKNSRIPDYRNTLYWNPSVEPGKDGKFRIEFWSSDNKSDYVINIQGITQQGRTISLRKIIKVK